VFDLLAKEWQYLHLEEAEEKLLPTFSRKLLFVPKLPSKNKVLHQEIRKSI
jgi:hypothetical protein